MIGDNYTLKCTEAINGYGKPLVGKGETLKGTRKKAFSVNGEALEGLEKNEVNRALVVVVNHCFTSLFGTKGLLSDIIIR